MGWGRIGRRLREGDCSTKEYSKVVEGERDRLGTREDGGRVNLPYRCRPV